VQAGRRWCRRPSGSGARRRAAGLPQLLLLLLLCIAPEL
jgi:hypothetical protein